jgi:hypothetical protein
MRPVIFLDLDGVLNCRESDWSQGLCADADKVALFNELVRRTGAWVVLSSTWRQDPEWRAKMEGLGLDFEFLDRTPRSSGGRGREIYAWLSKNRDLKSYAILDDRADMLALQKPHFFRTDWQTGLTREIADRVAAHLIPTRGGEGSGGVVS